MRRKVVFLVCLWVLTSVFVHTFGADAETASGGAEAPAGGDHGQFGGPNSVASVSVGISDRRANFWEWD